MSNLTHIDKQLLDLLQSDFPIVPRPFDELAGRLGISASEVIERVGRLKGEGIIRQISAIFDSAALGYTSELVAFQVDPRALDQVAAAVSAHKGVSHCYSRDADYNLWFTITLGPDENLGEAVDTLSRTPGVVECLRLPQTRMFKISVILDVTGQNATKRATTASRPVKTAAERGHLDERFHPFIRILQRDLPISATPFGDMAASADLSEAELISAANKLISLGAMRRFAAVLRHADAGFAHNAMVCWQAPADSIESAGTTLAEHPSVSHCYERAISPGWPWPLYTMIHCRTESELQRVIRELHSSVRGVVRSADQVQYRVLRTLREYKKTRVTYFD